MTESGSGSVSESKSRHDMRYHHEERDGHCGAAYREDVAAHSAVGIHTDSDSDSDPEAGNRAGLPNRPLEPTRLSWPAPRGTSCAGGSNARR
jgi:hypothetical protein